MGLSLSLVISAWDEIAKHQFFSLRDNINYTSEDGEMVILKSDSFKKTDSETITTRTDNSRNLKNYRPEKVILERTLSMLERSPSFTSLVQDKENLGSNNLDGKQNRLKSNLIPTISLPEPAILFSPRPVSELDAAAIKEVHKSYKSNLIPTISLPEPAILFSPRPVSELDAAAIKVQKVYKSYRTRRNLADCAVVIEELWWKALDFAALKRSSYSFFNEEKPETVVSKWARARTRAAKVGKGLSKDEKAQKLALQHWLEAIDPRHRYGHNLHLYYDIWFKSSSSQPFFYWLDVGTGKETDLEKCPRTVLQRQCIKYLGPKEREAYEVIVENGKLMFKQSGILVETTEGSKWIFVLSTLRALYVGKKKKGEFQHSSFLSGGATTAAGRLVAHNGIIEAIWPYSGHYHPTEENFREFIIFLEEHNVDLTNVKRCAIDDDSPSFKVTNEEPQTEPMVGAAKTKESEETDGATMEETEVADEANVEAPVFELTKRLSCKWTTGTGPRIGCVRDYPTELQFRALEQVNLSPRVTPGPFGNCGPIPSPRPSPKIRLSPRLAYMGLPSPRTPIAAAS